MSTLLISHQLVVVFAFLVLNSSLNSFNKCATLAEVCDTGKQSSNRYEINLYAF